MTPWTVARQAPLSMGFSHGQELEWAAISFSRDLSYSGIEPGSAFQADSLLSEPPGKPITTYKMQDKLGITVTA